MTHGTFSSGTGLRECPASSLSLLSPQEWWDLVRKALGLHFKGFPSPDKLALGPMEGSQAAPQQGPGLLQRGSLGILCYIKYCWAREFYLKIILISQKLGV